MLTWKEVAQEDLREALEKHPTDWAHIIAKKLIELRRDQINALWDSQFFRAPNGLPRKLRTSSPPGVHSLGNRGFPPATAMGWEFEFPTGGEIGNKKRRR